MVYTPVLTWWLLLQLFGLVGLPLALRLLGNLPDRGYAFARPLGLLLTGYVLWLGGSLGFWKNGVGGMLVAMLVVAGVGMWLYLSRRARDSADPAGGKGDRLLSPWGWLRGHVSYWLAVELLFAAALVGWTVYKSYNPNLETAGGEKWMEIAFVNATLRSDGFPPQDPWLSGYGISYYYFGYVLMAMLTRLSGLPAAVAYNLFAPTLLALTLAGAFSLVYNLVMRRAGGGEEGHPAGGAISFGFLGALFVGILGNLEGLLEVLHSRGLFPASFWYWLDIKNINQPPTPGGWIPTRFIWWWRASRVIHDCSFQGLLTGNCNPPHGDWEVIDEFPFFSFLLGDVHPHVLALPFVLLVLGLALSLLLNPSRTSNPRFQLATFSSQISNLVVSVFGGWIQFFVYAICLGALGFLNTWDFPIYLLVVMLAFALWRVRGGASSPWGPTGWVVETVAIGLALGVLGGVLYLPFYLGFQSQAGGILPNLFNPTQLQQFLVFFGPFLFVVVSYLVVLSGNIPAFNWRKRLPAALALTLGGPVLAMLGVGVALVVSPAARGWVEGLLRNPDLQAILGDSSLASLAAMAVRIRLGNPWTFLFLGGLLAWVLLFWPAVTSRKAPSSGAQLLSVNNLPAADTFALILIGVGLLLPLTVEFIYLRDIFGVRMNTVFKFYFQAWVLLALAAAYGASVVSSRLQGVGAIVWRLVLTLLVMGGLVYPVLAVPNKTGGFSATPTLDGMAWLETVHPDDHAAIRWLQANASDGAVILESPGDGHVAYQYVGRVSALTGLPTLLGWGGHEYQWRGNYDEPARREPEIDVLYNSVDPIQALTLLDKYDITYVYVGRLERERYNPSGLAKFERMMDVVYRQGEVTIYQRRGGVVSQ